jgi:hypothetical protein
MFWSVIETVLVENRNVAGHRVTCSVQYLIVFNMFIICVKWFWKHLFVVECCSLLIQLHLREQERTFRQREIVSEFVPDLGINFYNLFHQHQCTFYSVNITISKARRKHTSSANMKFKTVEFSLQLMENECKNAIHITKLFLVRRLGITYSEMKYIRSWSILITTETFTRKDIGLFRITCSCHR